MEYQHLENTNDIEDVGALNSDELTHLLSEKEEWKCLNRCNEKINNFLSRVRISSDTIHYLFVIFFISEFLRMIIDGGVIMAKETNLAPSFAYSFYRLSSYFTALAFFIFEFYTSKEICRRLDIIDFSFNIYILLFWLSFGMCEEYVSGGYQSFGEKSDIRFYYIYAYVFDYINNYSIYFILSVVTFEIISKLQEIMKKCCYDGKVSLETNLVVNPKADAMYNTNNYYAQFCSLHKLMELKILIIFVFSFWLIMLIVTSLSSFTIANAGLLILFTLSMIQPFFLQHIVKQIEDANEVKFRFSIKVLNVEINRLLFALPALSTIIAIVKAVRS